MRNIFLDCGAWNGCSVDFFKTNYPNSDLYEIYCFECLPQNVEILSKRDDIVLINKAVWDKNAKIKFYTADYTESGTIYLGKKTGGVKYHNPVIVESIDLAEFIINNFDKSDNIILKMNIEGAEYSVLEKMEKTGAKGYINKFYIQWHYGKIPSITKRRHDAVFSSVKSYSWGAMINDVANFKKSL